MTILAGAGCPDRILSCLITRPLIRMWPCRALRQQRGHAFLNSAHLISAQGENPSTVFPQLFFFFWWRLAIEDSSFDPTCSRGVCFTCVRGAEDGISVSLLPLTHPLERRNSSSFPLETSCCLFLLSVGWFSNWKSLCGLTELSLTNSCSLSAVCECISVIRTTRFRLSHLVSSYILQS